MPQSVPHQRTATQPQDTAESLIQPASGVLMHPGYAKAIARAAYVWGWPMVNMLNRRATITQAPFAGLLNGVLPAAPRGQLAMLSDYIEPSETFVTCPNQDVVYGLGFFSLDDEPVVLQVPNFGDRFWVYALYDARTDQFGQIGKPYGTKPGFYLLVGPNWQGQVPDGICEVFRSPTELANVIPRIFMDDTEEDRVAIQSVISQIVAYPLIAFDRRMKSYNWREAKTIEAPDSKGAGEHKWVVPEKFFDQLGTVLDTIAPLPGEEAMYAQYRALLEAASKSPAIKRALVETAIETEREVIAPFFEWRRNGLPAGNGWNRSTHNACWGLDYFNRTGTSKSNMFDNRSSETQYFYTDGDSSGEPLTGQKNYQVTFAAGHEPPVHGFWSLTLYNEAHLFHPNPLRRYSLGTKNKHLMRNPDGSLTLYIGAASPGAGKECNWLPAPEGSFSLYIRAYWAEEAILNGSWQPPKIVERA